MKKTCYLAMLLWLSACESRQVASYGTAQPFPAEDFKLLTTLEQGPAPRDYGIRLQIPELHRGYRCSLERVEISAVVKPPVKILLDADTYEVIDRGLRAREFYRYTITCLHQKHPAPLTATAVAVVPDDLVIAQGDSFNLREYGSGSYARIFMGENSKLVFDIEINANIVTAWEVIVDGQATVDLRRANDWLNLYEESSAIAGADLKPLPGEGVVPYGVSLPDFIKNFPVSFYWVTPEVDYPAHLYSQQPAPTVSPEDASFLRAITNNYGARPYSIDTFNPRLGWRLGEPVSEFPRSALHVRRLTGRLKVTARQLFAAKAQPLANLPEGKPKSAFQLLVEERTVDGIELSDKPDAQGNLFPPVCVSAGEEKFGEWNDECTVRRATHELVPLPPRSSTVQHH